MKDSGLLGFFGVVLGLALVGGALFSAWLIGPAGLTLIAYVFIGGVVLAAIIAASALPIRAYRRNDAKPVIEHHYHDGTTRVIEKHTIDGRQVQPTLYQLPAQPQGQVWPDLLRASWMAGQLSAPQHQDQDQAAPAELQPDDWNGPIN